MTEKIKTEIGNKNVIHRIYISLQWEEIQKKKNRID